MAYKNSKAQAAIGVVLSIGPKASAYTTPTLAITAASTTSGSPTITLSATPASIAAGMPITLTGIPAGSTVVSFIANTSITSSANATATASALAGTLSVFTPIGEASSAPVSGQKWDLEDITNFDSLQYKEFLKTLVDTGKVAITLNRVSNNAGQVLLKAAFLDPNGYQFQIALPLNQDQTTTGDSANFAALVESFEDTVQVGKAIKLQVGLQRTGAITTTLGT